MRLDDYAIARLKFCDGGANLNHITGSLMTGDNGRDAEGVLAVVCMNLRAADTAITHAYLNIGRFCDLWLAAVVAEIRNSDSFKISGSHMTIPFIKSLCHKIRQQHGYAGDIGDNDKHYQNRKNKWPNLAHHLL